jgi:hypothetical protein
VPPGMPMRHAITCLVRCRGTIVARNLILQLGRFPVRMALGSEQQTFEGELVRAVRCMVQGSAQWAGWTLKASKSIATARQREAPDSPSAWGNVCVHLARCQ